ncbi:MAG TPA: type I methionyl aminopeptidase, partial [Gammaproteobacteria bacterium]|nr:type I methionyl aminopeptidase [Gammaproteobacteria bacterium]
GDIINMDITVIHDGYHGDTSAMFHVGTPQPHAERLVNITKECLYRGIAEVRPGARLGDIGHAIQHHAEANYYSVVREYCGHGIGRVFHEDPQVLHYGQPGSREELVPGMTITVEPMVNAGKREVKLLSDGWTVVTKDHSLSAQWEHTVLVTPTGFEVLTLSPADRGT